jgi:aryl-alcohol dehydrogenase-like predicted oxidoreductase
VPLGTLEVSVIGLGCNNFGRALDETGSKAVVDAAIDSGMNFFDTSDNYGEGRSESYLGRALGSRRASVVIATKFGMAVNGVPDSGGARPDYVRRAVQRSLSELGTDWIDLYQLHKPDPTTPIGDTLDAMWDLVEEGLVREIGCTNLDVDQLGDAIAYARSTGRSGFVSNQMEYSLLHRDPQRNGLRELALDSGVALLPFYPLANGMLTGKVRRGAPIEGRLTMDRYQSYLTDENFETTERIADFAAERGITMVTVALGWLIAQRDIPAVTPGATKPEQVRSNAEAAAWEPQEDDLAVLDSITDS